jgi:POT family proton-dependent oligopeptide transporter
MLTGLAVFVAPIRVTQAVIMSGALAAAGGLFVFRPDNPFAIGVNVFVGVSLIVAAVIAWVALGRGGLPDEAGAPPDPERLRRPAVGPISAEWTVYLGTALAIPVFGLLVTANREVTLISESVVKRLTASQGGLVEVLAVFVQEMSKPAGLILMLAGLGAAAYLGIETFRLERVPRERMFVVLILTFFSMLFWAIFEQAGSSVNNFTDRNFDRVTDERRLSEQDVGTAIEFRVPLETTDPQLKTLPILSQEQLGHRNADPAMKEQITQAIRSEEQASKLPAPDQTLSPEDAAKIDELIASVSKSDELTLTGLTYLRAAAQRADAPAERKVVRWAVTSDNVGMVIGRTETPASLYQAVNPVYILLFGIVFSALWGFLGARGIEPSTPVKFALGLLQLGLGFGVFWYGAKIADARGIVALSWLFVGYLLQTTGELCLSPVGLSMVTKLSPTRLVSTVMGAWFLATAFSQFLAAIIAQFTGVGHGEGGGDGVVPVPKETVHIYGDVFGTIALTAIVSAVICFLLSPVLSRWMHEGQPQHPDSAAAPGKRS